MRRLKRLTLVLALALIVGLLAGTAAAQTTTPVTVAVDRDVITTGESLVVTVAIDSAAGRANPPELPPLDGFNILGQSSGTQMTLINGDLSVQATYQYRLQPLTTGDLVIGPIMVTVDGYTYGSQPITVHVTQGNGSGQPSTSPSVPAFPSLGGFPSLPSFPSFPSLPSDPTAPVQPLDPAAAPEGLVGQDFYVEAQVDKTDPYQGEQLLYTFRLFKAANPLGQISYQPPAFTGFWSEQLPDQAEYSLQAAGRNYRVTELKAVLFPTVVGDLTIDPAQLTIPGDFFSRDQSLQTRPLALTVKPLPNNAPPSFKGAVGRFDIAATADLAETTVNETVTQRVTLSGAGNLANLGDPAWPDSPAWRAFDSQGQTETRFENGLMVGSRVYERVLVPTQAGDLTLAAVAYTYFDPEAAQYVTINTAPIGVRVAPDLAASNTAPMQPTAGSGSRPDGLPPADQATLRPIKAAPAEWNAGSPDLARRPGYWLLWGVPLLLLVGHFGWQQWRGNWRAGVAGRRRLLAAGKARLALRRAGKNPAEAHKAAGQILTVYLAVMLDRSVGGLTQTGLVELLQERGVEANLADQVHNCLVWSELGRYAPAGATLGAPNGSATGDLLVETERLIAELEKVL